MRRKAWSCCLKIGVGFLILLLCCSQNYLVSIEAAEEGPGTLYSLSAVLLDGDTGRVLYGKEENTVRAMASTTKVMTCLLAIEHADGEESVEISARAASQPEVRMNTRKGEHYHMQDLLVAMMLKSYNDTAVAVAEYVGGSVEGFAEMMNAKAEKLGCKNTHFVTPNGLDDVDAEGRKHSTTARDLAIIMRYAIHNPVFVTLTRMREYSFSNIEKTRSFYVQNANAYLSMRPGVISGKTGFTGEAGYCYVCAYENQGRVFIVALLGCGWPGNKTFKWKDMDKLLDYAEKTYQLESFWQDTEFLPVQVKGGISDSGNLNEGASLLPVCPERENGKDDRILLKQGEEVQIHREISRELSAPIAMGEKIGEIWYTLGDLKIASYDILSGNEVKKITWEWCINQIFRRFFHN